MEIKNSEQRDIASINRHRKRLQDANPYFCQNLLTYCETLGVDTKEFRSDSILRGISLAKVRNTAIGKDNYFPRPDEFISVLNLFYNLFDIEMDFKNKITPKEIRKQIEDEKNKHLAGDRFIPNNKWEDITEEHKEKMHAAFKEYVANGHNILCEMFMEDTISLHDNFYLYRIKNDFYVVKGERSRYLLYIQPSDARYIGTFTDGEIEALKHEFEPRSGFEMLKEYKSIQETDGKDVALTFLKFKRDTGVITEKEYIEILERA